ncbi:MAG: hypothetical protein ACOC03_05145, partial [Desulfosalsimonas sp.]
MADSGRLASFTDVRGHTTTFSHAADRMTVTRPDDSFTEVIFQAETGLVAAVNYSDRCTIQKLIRNKNQTDRGLR